MRDWPKTPKPRFPRAIFLDRDGTINEDTHFPHSPGQLRFVEGSLQALAILGELPFHLIVVSNQAGIALGRFTIEQMSRFNEAIRTAANNKPHGRIDAFYYCPHLEAKHLPPGEKPCGCSKPSPGMLLEAAADYGLDLQQSVMVGDKSSDIRAGLDAGCLSILLQTGKAGKEPHAPPSVPHYTFPSLLDAATWLTLHHRDLFYSQHQAGIGG